MKPPSSINAAERDYGDEGGYPSTGKGDTTAVATREKLGVPSGSEKRAPDPTKPLSFHSWFHYALEDMLLVPGSGGCKTNQWMYCGSK